MLRPVSSQAEFYDQAYRRGQAEGDRFARWRELSARAKADHVAELASRIGLRLHTAVDVGCGDGAVLAELSRRGFAREYAGFDLSEPAVEALRARRLPDLRRAEVFDGSRLPVEDAEFDLALLSHVLEHVEDPGALLAEAARAATSVVIEVPLERNVSAGREQAADVREEIGHLQRFDRAAVRALAERAGLEVAAELSDPLRREVHLFFADTPGARARALAKAAVRRSAFTLSSRLAERLFTVHYACIATRRD
jgi:SAM-dependent methyltransferase